MSIESTKSRLFLISLPALLALLLLLSAGGLLFAGYVGRPATGERVTIHVASGCTPEWGERLAQRADAIGLGTPDLQVVGNRVLLTATLPGNPDDRTAVPALLTADGRLSLHVQDGETVASEADMAEVRLSMSYLGRATVVLGPSEPAWARIRALPLDSVLVATLDGESVELGELRRVGRDDELHVQPARERSRDELQMAADWAILLQTGPAPCAVADLSVSQAADGT